MSLFRLAVCAAALAASVPAAAQAQVRPTPTPGPVVRPFVPADPGGHERQRLRRACFGSETPPAPLCRRVFGDDPDRRRPPVTAEPGRPLPK
jgi:hypothetical protein